MLVSFAWLKTVVDVQGTVEDVCAALTEAGIETEVAEDARPAWDGVITARLTSVERHPNADKLTVTRPTDGENEWDVVCGATNHAAGDIVALATVGTVLPGDFKIKRSKIRGERSEGMLCSEAELGLSEEADGILILPADTPLGRPLSEVLEAGDVVLDVSPEANRGDCLSILGLARELSAVTGWELLRRGGSATSSAAAATFDDLQTLAVVTPVGGVLAGRVGEGDSSVRVELVAHDGCPRYAAALMTSIRIAPSPRWMQERLEAAGLRPINNVVDCTNYVMLELGNPLHAFDRRFVRGGRVVVRRAEAGEPVRTLDGGEHSLDTGDLVIADAEGVIALAGVMGGENSEVRDDTTELFLESAHFEPGTVRRTAHRCKLGTESSYRFARGVDPELPCAALQRLVELLESTAGGSLVGTVTDLYPRPLSRPEVLCRWERIPGLLGLELEPARVRELLVRDGLEILREDASGLRVRPPSYRFDIEREVDVLEEIARLQGYVSIPEVPLTRPLRVPARQKKGEQRRSARRALVAAGLSEAIHFSFIDPSWIAALGLPEDHPWRSRTVPVSNPLSEVGGILRPTLLPSLLRAVGRNLAMGAADVRLFELRPVFSQRPEGFAEIVAGRDGRPLDRAPANERLTASGVITGRRAAPGWDSEDAAVDFHDLRSCVDSLQRALRWRGWSWSTDGLPSFLDPREAAVLVGAGGRGSAGWIGRIAVPVLRAFEIDQVVYAFELDVAALAPKKTQVPSFVPFSRFPAVERDLAFVVPDAVAADWVLANVERAARKGMKDSFLGVELFDVYRGKGIPDAARSLALRFRFRAPDRTLEDKAVDRVMERVEKSLEQHEGITLRR